MRMPAIRPDIIHSHHSRGTRVSGRAIDADDAAIDAAAVIDELLFQPRATGKKHKGFRVNKMETLVVCKSQ